VGFKFHTKRPYTIIPVPSLNMSNFCMKFRISCIRNDNYNLLVPINAHVVLIYISSSPFSHPHGAHKPKRVAAR